MKGLLLPSGIFFPKRRCTKRELKSVTVTRCQLVCWALCRFQPNFVDAISLCCRYFLKTIKAWSLKVGFWWSTLDFFLAWLKLLKRLMSACRKVGEQIHLEFSRHIKTKRILGLEFFQCNSAVALPYQMNVVYSNGKQTRLWRVFFLACVDSHKAVFQLLEPWGLERHAKAFATQREMSSQLKQDGLTNHWPSCQN